MKRGCPDSDEEYFCFHDYLRVVEDKRKWLIFRVISGYCKECGSHVVRVTVGF